MAGMVEVDPLVVVAFDESATRFAFTISVDGQIAGDLQYGIVLSSAPTMAISDDEDDLIASLEAEAEHEPSLSHLREARVQALASEFARAKSQRNEGYGTYQQIKDEKSLLDITTSTKNCIVHFYKPDFNRCRIMDGHLQLLCEKHLETRFLKMDVEHAPFLVTKLKVKVLPCVIGFVNGISVERIVGFEGLGVGDQFESEALERSLVAAGVLDELKVIGSNVFQTSQGRRQGKVDDKDGDDDDDDDWD